MPCPSLFNFFQPIFLKKISGRFGDSIQKKTWFLEEHYAIYALVKQPKPKSPTVF